MPISDLQARVLTWLAANRSPDSYVAGATVLHRGARSPRISQDLDIFHDVAERVAESATTDARTVDKAGGEVTWLLRAPTFHRAIVTVEGQTLQLEWAQDSAFRFFPLVKDPRFGYRLHDADAAVNKVLALAGRSEVRDFIDVLHLNDTGMSLGALAWAACGKDPGFTPAFLLEQAARHVAYTQADVDRLVLRRPLDIKTLKALWCAAVDDARSLVSVLPADDIGCLYLDREGSPRTPDPQDPGFPSLTRHWGQPRGAWPVATPYPPEVAPPPTKPD